MSQSHLSNSVNSEFFTQICVYARGLQLLFVQLIDDGTPHVLGLGVGHHFTTPHSRLLVRGENLLINRVHGLLYPSQVHWLRMDHLSILVLASLQGLASSSSFSFPKKIVRFFDFHLLGSTLVTDDQLKPASVLSGVW